MRAVNKIIFLGVALVILSSLCSSFSCLTDTYSYFGDTKKVNVNLSTAKLDSDASLIKPSNYKFPTNETLNGTTSVTRKNPMGSQTGNSSVVANSSRNDFSAAGNNANNLTTNNSISATLPIANFSSNVTSGYAPLSVQFIDLSVDAKEWNWDFENESTSTEQNPIHIYSSSGTYTVNLTVSNTNGTDSKLNEISVLEKPAKALLPVANFSNNISTGYVPITIKFTDFSENATVWDWDFGDGNYSTVKNPVHTYFVPGNYTVTLAASNENGTNSTCSSITVLQTINPVSVEKETCNKRDSYA
jgi:PKD repeat protein